MPNMVDKIVFCSPPLRRRPRFGTRSAAKESSKLSHGGQVRLLSPTADEAASAGNVIGGAGDEQAHPDGQVCLLSPTVEEAASAGNAIGGAGYEQA